MRKWIYLRCWAEKWREGELKTEKKKKNGGFTDPTTAIHRHNS